MFSAGEWWWWCPIPREWEWEWAECSRALSVGAIAERLGRVESRGDRVLEASWQMAEAAESRNSRLVEL